MKLFIRMVALAVISSSLLGLSIACNTVEGAGKDTKKAGQAIENSADANK